MARAKKAASEVLYRLRSYAPLAVIVTVASMPAFADGIAPGLWKITESATVNGMAMPPQVKNRCLTPEAAADTAKTFSPQFGTVNSECQRTEFTSTSEVLTWRLQCRGQADMDVAAEFKFDGPKHYTATIVSKGTMAGQQLVSSSTNLEAEHVGECR
jgi:hypothetical protein